MKLKTLMLLMVSFYLIIFIYSALIIMNYAVLKIDGPKNLCGFCKGDVKTLARQMNLDSLTIIDADGAEYFFDKKGLNKIKEGGMSYKQAKKH